MAKDKERYGYDDVLVNGKKKPKDQLIDEDIVKDEKPLSMNFGFDALIRGFKEEIEREKEQKQKEKKKKEDKENKKEDNKETHDDRKDSRAHDERLFKEDMDSIERERAYHEYLLRYEYDHDLDTISDQIEEKRDAETLFHECEDLDGDGVRDIDEYEQEKDDDEFYEEYFGSRM